MRARRKTNRGYTSQGHVGARRGCLSRLKKKKWYYQQHLRSHNATSAEEGRTIDSGLRKSQKKQVSAIFSCACQKNVVPLSRKDNTTHETIF